MKIKDLKNMVNNISSDMDDFEVVCPFLVPKYGYEEVFEEYKKANITTTKINPENQTITFDIFS